MLIVTLALTLGGLRLQKSIINSKTSTKEAKIIVTSIGYKSEQHYKFVSATALELLRLNHSVKLKNTFIECIDDTGAESGFWWPLFVNGKESSEGASFYKVGDGDTIEFKFSKK